MKHVVGVLTFALFAASIARAASDDDDANADCDQAPTAASMLADDLGKERWPLTLPQAIRIALDNCEFACVLNARMPDGTVTELDSRDAGACLDYQPYYEMPLGFSDNPPRKARIAGPLMIQRVKADAPLWKSRANVMALVRSVEQQYWIVVANRVHVASAEQAVYTATDAVEEETRDLYNINSPDLVEAMQQRDQFQKDLKTKTAELADADRRFRVILGLPPADA